MDKTFTVLRWVVSGLLAGAIFSFGSYMAVVSDTGAKMFTDINQTTWGIIIGGGVIQAAKDWLVAMRKPPTVKLLERIGAASGDDQ